MLGATEPMHRHCKCSVDGAVGHFYFVTPNETKDLFTMNRLSRLLPLLLASSIVAVGAAGATEAAAPTDKDTLRAVLAESKDRNRSVTMYTHGASIALVVTALDDRYVFGRSQQASIVVRIDQIDIVAAAF